MSDLPLAVYCHWCGAYVFLIGEKDFVCSECGDEFEVVERTEASDVK